MSEVRLSERERQQYDALPEGGKLAYRNLRESNTSHALALEFAQRTEADLADALVDAAAALEDDPTATDDLVFAENDIAIVLEVAGKLSLDETEQGLTANAAKLIYGFAREHTTKPELANLVMGDPKDPREMELLQEDIAERTGGIAMGVNPRPLKRRESHSENQLIAEAFGKDGAVRFVPVEGEKPGRPFILNSDAVEKLYETLARIR